MKKTYEEINQKILEGNACVLTAEEMVKLVEKEGIEYAAEEVDVVTTGTFGCMCSSGAFFNIPQPDPPIKIDTLTVDGVPAYHGNAAADFYLGVTKPVNGDSEYQVDREKYENIKYGGGHVLEKLVSNENVHISAISLGTDCYPRKSLEITLNLADFNQAIMLNPRNAYQRYVCAVNQSDSVMYTYMGKLLPNLKNGTFGGVGTMSPLNNDPTYRTIGIGTRIFLGGGIGHIIGQGTQHNPQARFGNIMVRGDLKNMSPKFLSGASVTHYGMSCFLGLGIPIPILDDNLALSCSIPDSEIMTDVVDYSTRTRDRPILQEVSYEDLKSRKITIDNKDIPLSSTSSFYKSREITKILKEWIKHHKFTLSPPIKNLPTTTEFNSLPKKVSEL